MLPRCLCACTQSSVVRAAVRPGYPVGPANFLGCGVFRHRTPTARQQTSARPASSQHKAIWQLGLRLSGIQRGQPSPRASHHRQSHSPDQHQDRRPISTCLTRSFCSGRRCRRVVFKAAGRLRQQHLRGGTAVAGKLQRGWRNPRTRFRRWKNGQDWLGHQVLSMSLPVPCNLT